MKGQAADNENVLCPYCDEVITVSDYRFEGGKSNVVKCSHCQLYFNLVKIYRWKTIPGDNENYFIRASCKWCHNISKGET